MLSRAAISSLSMPLAAIKIILALTTSKYGNVYLLARRLSSAASAADSLILKGLFLGIRDLSSKDRTKMPYVVKLINHIRCHIYETAYLANTRCERTSRVQQIEMQERRQLDLLNRVRAAVCPGT
jgi:hypothetical protein